MPPKPKAQVLADLGLACFKKGETDRGVQFLEEALPLAEADEANAKLAATILENLGAMYGAMSNFDESARYLERALEAQEKELGNNHPDLVGTLQSLIVISSKRGETAKAAAYMQRAGEMEAAWKAQQSATESGLAAAPKIVELES